MKFFLAGVILALAFGTVSYSAVAQRCRTGEAQAFLALQSEPLFLVGTIPVSFTSNPRYFTRRYNCKGSSAFIRRVDLGLYDVRFPGISVRLAVTTAISDEGITASVWPLGNGTVRVALRGPLGGGDVASRRDVPFSVVIY